MNTEYPHDIINHADLIELVLAKREKYVPIPARAAKKLQLEAATGRAAWLSPYMSKKRTAGDEVRIARAQAKRDRKRLARLQLA